MKKLVSVLCAALLLLCTGMPALAVEGEPVIESEGGERFEKQKCTYTLPDGGVLYFREEVLTTEDDLQGMDEPVWILYESDNLKGDLVIPEFINGVPVEGIYYENSTTGEGANDLCLSGNPELISVTFPSTLKKIMGNRETRLLYNPEGWFWGCDQLEEIIFTDDTLEIIPRFFFRGAPSLKRVKLPKNVAEMDGAFVPYPLGQEETSVPVNLESLELDPANKNFVIDEQDIVYDAKKLKVVTAIQGAAERKTATLPDTVEELADYAFAGNTNLERIYGGRYMIWGSTGLFDGCAVLNPFKDMYGHWAEETAKWAYHHNIFSGTSTMLFFPEAQIGRGELCKELYNIEGRPDSSCSPLRFSDVQCNMPEFWPAINWAADYGLVQGYGDGKFHLNAHVTREQMATVLYRYAAYKGIGGTRGTLDGFLDAGSVSTYACTAMEWAVGSGLLHGRGNGTLAPQDIVTLAEAAAMMQRLDTLLVDRVS